MRNPENKSKLVKAFRKAMSNDRAQHTILPLTKFGLMQITRQRTRPELNIKTAEVCPSCKGTGKVTPSLLVTDDIQRNLDIIQGSHAKSKLTIEVHPYVKSHLTKGFPSTRMKWYMKYNKWINLKADPNLALNNYKFFDQNDDEIRFT